jgi:hypothetical protein
MLNMGDLCERPRPRPTCGGSGGVADTDTDRLAAIVERVRSFSGLDLNCACPAPRIRAMRAGGTLSTARPGWRRSCACSGSAGRAAAVAAASAPGEAAATRRTLRLIEACGPITCIRASPTSTCDGGRATETSRDRVTGRACR